MRHESRVYESLDAQYEVNQAGKYRRRALLGDLAHSRRSTITRQQMQQFVAAVFTTEWNCVTALVHFFGCGLVWRRAFCVLL